MKRRQITALLDVHIAQWLAGDAITPSERRRLDYEKARRKALAPDRPVGVLVGPEGCTPAQRALVVELLRGSGATEIHHPGVASALHQDCKRLGVPVWVHDDAGMWEVVRACTGGLVIAAPKETSEPTRKTGVWDMIRYAKHRSIAVRIALPDGSNGSGPSQVKGST